MCVALFVLGFEFNVVIFVVKWVFDDLCFIGELSIVEDSYV